LATKKEHVCEWRTLAAKLEMELAKKEAQHQALTARVNEELAEKEAQHQALTARVNEIEHTLALANKALFGRKSERIPTPEQEAKKRSGKKPLRGGHTNPKKRKENAEALTTLETETVEHKIPDEQCVCPHCGEVIVLISHGEETVEYDWIPGKLIRRIHNIETGRCPCKMHYARADGPARVREGCTYGPAFLAKLAIDKCADSTPLYRVEKAMRRAGFPISRSTMNDLILLAGDVCMPLWRAALAEVRTDPHVQADETSFRMQARPGRSFVWTFLSTELTVYFFSPSRSGDTPKEVLGGSTGALTVDGHTGYNIVTDVDGRERSGCWSHARRYFFEALPTAPEAREGLDIILELFMVERKARSGGIVGTDEHLELLRRRSAAEIEKLRQWKDKSMPLFEPKSPMGKALRYLDNQWPRLIVFLDDPQIPIHNNASEAALRILALARKNSLFFGNDVAARKYMVLYSLIATCERHDINPQVYLADILLRVRDHPEHRLGELLPHRWKDVHGRAYTVERVVTPSTDDDDS